ncbi:hypothetical protein [Streptomyces sp. NPDC093598]|uniref:sodium:solute symporter family transporter n=1 Tax=Streptomyces sp. NPDC093598 TaxID=3366046 RepID=UPI00381990D5
MFFTVYVASGLVAGGLLFEQVFDIRFGLGVTLTALVIVVYACLGGFLAVSMTHVMQGTLGDALDGKTPELLGMGARVGCADGQWSAGGSLGAVATISLQSAPDPGPRPDLRGL